MTTMTHSLKELAVEAAKSSPPVAVVATSYAHGWTLNTVLTAVTIVYVLLQAAYLVWKWWHQLKARRADLLELG